MPKIKLLFYLLVLCIALPSLALADKGEEAFEKAREYDRSNETDKAVAALKEAVDAGHLEAHNKLAYWYWKGNGVEKDVERARELFTAAAEEDLAIAQYQLAELIMSTDGDAEAAVKWYERAAHQKHVPAMSKAAAIYADEDNDVETNLPLAQAWYLVAKEAGGYVSEGKLEFIERKMSHNEKDEAKNLYKELLEKLTS
ncbi:TPR repeat protein [Methylohalomonas lacus]|uniref:TPR repeat protein n=1 Tax=Methylohalomonas lacus TaxID=398773 RepID=A0AAE3L3U7_9GAMM|nr:tetratricopeptide repeat protein [Methylohalomonas lacus]MCS3902783.1 TPR repeat protein [Methylohalomonas lacus]